MNDHVRMEPLNLAGVTAQREMLGWSRTLTRPWSRRGAAFERAEFGRFPAPQRDPPERAAASAADEHVGCLATARAIRGRDELTGQRPHDDPELAPIR